MTEEIKQELCRLGSLVGTDAKNPKENLINFVEDLLSQALQKRDGEIIEFINSGYNSPASDTGYSICLDDVINFINSK